MNPRRSVRLNCYAKVNLVLEVLSKRADTYHELHTLFERIDLCDTLTLTSRRDNRIELFCDHPVLPCDASNLAWRAAQVLKESLKISQGVTIRLKKRIPVGSGLGGGSSDAAGVLMGLNKLWRLGLSRRQLVSYANRLGSDVAFFIHETRFAWGRGRGEKISPVKALAQASFWHVLVVPKLHVSTPLIYKKWDEFYGTHINLTKAGIDVKLLVSASKNKVPSLLTNYLYNSLEPVTVRLYPEVAGIKAQLCELGVNALLMSGSGPAVFGIVASRKEAVTVCQRLKEQRSWHVFVTRTR